jgi:hypothetical protein
MFYMNHLHPVKSMVFYFMWQRLFYTRPLLLFLRTCTSCASLLQFLSTWIICTQYSLCSSTSLDDNFYSTFTASMQPPQSSTPTALHMPLYYSTCLRDVYVTSAWRLRYALLCHYVLSTTSAPRHWPIMVETSARLHFTHQTETSTFVYIYISRTFSWLLQQNWQCSELPDPSSFSIQTFFQDYTLSTTSQLGTFCEHFREHYNSASKHSSVSPSPHSKFS